MVLCMCYLPTLTAPTASKTCPCGASKTSRPSCWSRCLSDFMHDQVHACKLGREQCMLSHSVHVTVTQVGKGLECGLGPFQIARRCSRYCFGGHPRHPNNAGGLTHTASMPQLNGTLRPFICLFQNQPTHARAPSKAGQSTLRATRVETIGAIIEGRHNATGTTKETENGPFLLLLPRSRERATRPARDPPHERYTASILEINTHDTLIPTVEKRRDDSLDRIPHHREVLAVPPGVLQRFSVSTKDQEQFVSGSL